MLAITTLEEAHRIWEEFNLKYQQLIQRNAHSSPYFITPSASSKQKDYINGTFNLFTPKSPKVGSLDDAARIIQRNWYKYITGSLIPINPQGQHSPEFRHFTHNQKIKKSLHPKKLKELKTALQQGNWNAAIFSDETLPHVYLAMGLFDSGAITQQQMFTILERFQTFKDKNSFKHHGTFNILNSASEFTPEAFEILIPALMASREAFSEIHFQAFKFLIAALPLSEQIFYTSSLGNFNPESQEKSLLRVLFKSKSIYHRNNEFIYLSAGVSDALGITLYGLKEYIRPMPKLGKQSLADIEEGVRGFSRYTVLHYPDSYQYTMVHEYKNITPVESTKHDKYHSLLMSKIPKDILSAFWRMVDISRETTQLPWSKEIWNWIDMASEYFITSDEIIIINNYTKYLKYLSLFLAQQEKSSLNFEEFLTDLETFLETRNELSKNEQDHVIHGAYFAQEVRNNNNSSFLYLMKKTEELNSREMTDLLCRIISSGLGSNNETGQGFYLFIKNKTITTLGIVVVLDMIRNPDEWKKFKIDPQHLLNDDLTVFPLKFYFQLFNNIWHLMENDSSLIQIFKCHIYCILYNHIGHNNLDQFQHICEMIRENEISISAKLGFEKIKTPNRDLQNTIVLTYAGSVLTKPAITHLIDNNFRESKATTSVNLSSRRL